MAKEKLILDRQGKRLQRLHSVIGWLLERWDRFPDNLHELVDGEYLEFDVRAFLWEMIREDFANIITPAIANNWKVLLRENGVILPDDEPG